MLNLLKVAMCVKNAGVQSAVDNNLTQTNKIDFN